MSVSSASQLEWSLVSFAGSDSTLASSSKFTAIGIPIGKPVIGVDGGGGGGETIIRGTAIIRGNTVV